MVEAQAHHGNQHHQAPQQPYQPVPPPQPYQPIPQQPQRPNSFLQGFQAGGQLPAGAGYVQQPPSIEILPDGRRVIQPISLEVPQGPPGVQPISYEILPDGRRVAQPISIEVPQAGYYPQHGARYGQGQGFAHPGGAPATYPGAPVHSQPPPSVPHAQPPAHNVYPGAPSPGYAGGQGGQGGHTG